jgi:murein DD-endopeptidase MepM/ murein hydrolase activator NlpD
MYPGQAISGTGIPASSVISSLDASGTDIIIGSAVGTPVNATATGTVTATLTNTGYGIVQVLSPTFQSQIT